MASIRLGIRAPFPAAETVSSRLRAAPPAGSAALDTAPRIRVPAQASPQASPRAVLTRDGGAAMRKNAGVSPPTQCAGLVSALGACEELPQRGGGACGGGGGSFPIPKRGSVVARSSRHQTFSSFEDMPLHSSDLAPAFEAPQKRQIPPAISAKRGSVAARSSRHQTFSSFEDMLHSSDVVLVDFYATWCGPCKHMADVLQELSHRMLDSVKIMKIDTEKYPRLASQYGVTALPTIVLFRQGKPVDRIEGMLPPEELILRLASLLATSPH